LINGIYEKDHTYGSYCKYTSVDHDIIHGKYASILKMNVMMWLVCSSH
jgi:hypothetical protein